MDPEMTADVARLLSALLDEKAWFRRGLSDGRLADLTGMPLHHAVIARVEAEAQGLVERRDVGTDHAVTMLTPLGVASAHGLLPRTEEPTEEPTDEPPRDD
ncbi:MAG: hypothetical protein FJX73_01200 [Armatimonadetes bacterium]|nr:hypothetical protein [Armatimonadota bacterium]